MKFWDNILGQNDPFAPAGTPFGNFIHVTSSLFQFSSHLDIMIAVEVKMK